MCLWKCTCMKCVCMHLDVMLQQIFIMNSTTYGSSKMFSSKNISDVLVYDFTSKCLLWLKWNVHYGYTKEDEALCSFHWHTLGYSAICSFKANLWMVQLHGFQLKALESSSWYIPKGQSCACKILQKIQS